MNSSLILAVVAIVTAAMAVYFFLRAQKYRVAQITAEQQLQSRESELFNARQAQDTLAKEKEQLYQELLSRREESATLKTSLEMERKQFDEKIALLNDSREQLSQSFKNIANEIFEEKSQKFTSTSKESLSHVLAPLQEKISRFEKRVEETYDKESKERFSLAKEIKNLQDLNARISEEAVNLTNALKGDNKAQGTWGEFVLESILEKSGLVKGREYEVQVSLKGDEGEKLQPDVVVHLPESRDIIIDSKVSLKAWDEYCSSDDAARRPELLKQHIQSLRGHVRNLASKDYQNLSGLNSLDYVFLFMPIEAAYSQAVQHDADLFQFAFERNIIFVVPSTLLTTLKTVQNLWRLAQQSQNAIEIAKRAGDLYDKFVNFVDDLEDVGMRIDASRKSYDKAYNKLKSGRGNLIRRIETLKELGAKTSKKQDQDLLASAKESHRQAAIEAPEGSAAEVSADNSSAGQGSQSDEAAPNKKSQPH